METSRMSVRDRLMDARGDAVAITSPVLPRIDAAIAEYDAANPSQSQWPAWRRAMTVAGGLQKIPGTDPRLRGVPGIAAYDYWTSPLWTDDGICIWPTPGGHNADSASPGHRNTSWAMTLWHDDPGATIQKVNDGTPESYFRAGVNGPAYLDGGAVTYTYGLYRQTAIDNGFVSSGDYRGANIWWYNEHICPQRNYYPGPLPDTWVRAPDHGWYNRQYIAAAHAFDGQARAIIFGMAAPRGPAGTQSRQQVDGLKIGPLGGPEWVWDRPAAPGVDPRTEAGAGSGVWQRHPNPGQTGSSIVAVYARDYRNGKIYRWSGGSYGLSVFDPSIASGERWTILSPTPFAAAPNNLDGKPFLVDTLRNRLVILANATIGDGETPARIRYWNLSAGGALQFVDTDLYSAASAPRKPLGDYQNAVHDRDNDRYILLWREQNPTTERLIAINPDTGAASVLRTGIMLGGTGVFQGMSFQQELGGVVIAGNVGSNFHSDFWFLPTRD
jgi:hypothetical protein